jgi:hypothetical protein
LGAGTVLMGTNDRTVDHGVFVVGIRCQNLEYLLPHSALDAVDGSSTGTRVP